MKDVKIARFVELITKGKTAIEAAKESGISHLLMGEVLTELSKEDYEEFIARMIDEKKWKIERELDLI